MGWMKRYFLTLWHLIKKSMKDERLGIANPLPLPGSRKKFIYPVLIVPLLGIVRDEQRNKQLLLNLQSKRLENLFK